MKWLNYNHLQYFWFVAKAGSIAQVAKDLNIAPPTISTQIATLEASLNQQLFERTGRKLVLTQAGKIVYEYADDMFNIGKEMIHAISQDQIDRRSKLTVGVTQSVPKLLVQSILSPIFRLKPTPQVIFKEGDFQHLLTDLANYKIDIILSHEPVNSSHNIKAYSHLLGSTGFTFFAAPKLAKKLKPNFPESLHKAPVLLPTHGTAKRALLDAWFFEHGVQPTVAAEFDDSALLKIFGVDGLGFFTAPTIIAKFTEKRYYVEEIGSTDKTKMSFYAISGERKLKNQAVLAITENARKGIFG